MRIAALAFGVLAGLVALLSLTLHGLDVGELPYDARSLSLITFGLYILAGVGIFGAGIVLAAPLPGAILFALGAVGWVAVALLLHVHSIYVALIPPALLLVATVLAILAFRRRRQQDFELEPLDRRALRADAPEEDYRDDSYDHEPAALPVNASFFGDAGTATPLRGAISRPPEPRQNGGRSQVEDEWEPVRRPTPPPRQGNNFREPDDYDDEESGFSRVARGISAVLSFGLYAALAGAAVLVALNLHTFTGPNHPSAVKLEASVAPSSVHPSSSSAATQEAALSPALQAPSLVPTLVAPSSAMAAVADGPMDDATRQLMGQDTSFSPVAAPDNTAGSPPNGSADAMAPDASSAPPDASSAAPVSNSSATVMPYPMPSEIAAARAHPAPRSTTTAKPTTTRPSGADTGL